MKEKSEWLKGFTVGVFVTVVMYSILLLIADRTHAQDKPAAKPPAAEPSKSTEPPAMSAETGNKLRDVVLEQAKLVIQLKDTITTYNNLQGALNAEAKKVDDAKALALKEAKLDPQKWDVDMDKFVFVPRAAPTAKPEEKKP
jgi:hypothetical protein